MDSPLGSVTQRGATTSCLAFMFSAVTSALQPARMPIALLAVLLIAGLAPLVDLASGKSYGPRGLNAAPLSTTELELGLERARAAAARVASEEVSELETESRAEAGGTTTPALSRGDLAACVRAATERKVADRLANGAAKDDPELIRLRQRAAEAMLVIEETAPRGLATVLLHAERMAVQQASAGLLRLDFNAALGAVVAAVFTLPMTAIHQAPVVFGLALVIVLCIVTVLAGGSCRMAAVHAGRGGRLSPTEGAQYARARLLNLVSLPVLPTLLISAFALVVFVFVLLLRVPVLNVLSGALFVVPIVFALMGSILALTTIAGFPLMPAAIAVEDCDAGDAITRAAALVLARPLLWLGILAGSLVALVFGGLLVTGVVGAASSAVDGLLASFGGDAGRALSANHAADVAALFGPDRLIALMVGFWNGILDATVAAYLFTLAFDLSTRGYLVLRERIDGENPATISGYGIS